MPRAHAHDAAVAVGVLERDVEAQLIDVELLCLGEIISRQDRDGSFHSLMLRAGGGPIAGLEAGRRGYQPEPFDDDLYTFGSSAIRDSVMAIATIVAERRLKSIGGSWPRPRSTKPVRCMSTAVSSGLAIIASSKKGR